MHCPFTPLPPPTMPPTGTRVSGYRFQHNTPIIAQCFVLRHPRRQAPRDSDIRNPKPRRQRATRRAAINHRAACERSPAGLGWGYSQMSQNGGGWEEKPRRSFAGKQRGASSSARARGLLLMPESQASLAEVRTWKGSASAGGAPPAEGLGRFFYFRMVTWRTPA